MTARGVDAPRLALHLALADELVQPTARDALCLEVGRPDDAKAADDLEGSTVVISRHDDGRIHNVGGYVQLPTFASISSVGDVRIVVTLLVHRYQVLYPHLKRSPAAARDSFAPLIAVS